MLAGSHEETGIHSGEDEHCPLAYAQNPDDYRGGWYGFRRPAYLGVFHPWRCGSGHLLRCSDATTLAFIDGKFGPDGITVTHVKADSTLFRIVPLQNSTKGISSYLEPR